MKTMQSNQKDYKSNERIEILSIPKKEFNGKDFFARQEFRGLFLADHQEALGKKAFDCVDNLNQKTVNKFNSVESFRESINIRNTMSNFYKSNTKLKPCLTTGYKDSSDNLNACSSLIRPEPNRTLNNSTTARSSRNGLSITMPVGGGTTPMGHPNKGFAVADIKNDTWTNLRD